ncbi:MAG: hypothetical protein DME32_13995, partial [Verrucomicrobia bacterium]
MRAIAIWSLSFLCAVLFILQFKGWPAPFVLEMEIQTERDARLELRYDQGGGFRRQDSVVDVVNGDSQFQVVRFRIAASQLHNLNLRQYEGSDSMRLRRCRLKMPGRKPVEIAADKIRSVQPGTTVAQDNDVAEIRGIDGNANVAVVLPAGFEESRTSRRSRGGIVILLCLNVLALVLFVLKPRPAGSALRDSKQRLISNAILIVLVLGYVATSLAKLNGSATALWRIYADRQAPTAGLIFGTPKAIRSDEWVGETPWILSQAARRFPVENPGVGDGVMPLLNNLPARHWTMLFRPQMWGFFMTDVEHAFAFYWNFKWFGLLLGAFLFLQAIARG